MSSKSDRHKSSDDRHKGRVHPSGSEKRRKAKEKEIAQSKILSQTPRLTEYISIETSKTKSSENIEFEESVSKIYKCINN